MNAVAHSLWVSALALLLAGCGGSSSAPPPLAVSTSSLASATAHAPYSAELVANGGTAPYSWSLKAGALPSGISLSPDGVISGNPFAGGTANFTVLVSDSGSPAQVATQALTLKVSVAPLAVATNALPDAAVSSGFTATLAAQGGSGSYSWSVQSGLLPAGVTLSPSGSLSGVPTSVGIFTFAATVSDASIPQQTASETYNLLVAATGPTTQVALAATPSSISMGGAFAGLSYEKHTMSSALFSPGNSTLIALFSRLGPSLLRIGGNSVDHTLWSASGPGETTDQVSPSDVDRLAGFLQACNWQVLYGIEFLDEAASPVAPTDPSLVANEAVYAMQSLGDRLYGFELGNEPDLYHNQISGFTYSNFQSDWQIYRDAILAAVAAAKSAGTLPQSAIPRFTGPAAAYDQTDYITPFAANESSNIFLLTRHYYVANGQNVTSTMTLLLTPDPNLPPELAAMESSAAGNHIASGYRISEANSFYNGGAPGVSDGFGTSLWAINFLFTNAWAGSIGVNFHGGGDGPGYTPIADNGVAALEARPEYYGIYLFSQAANGQLVATTSTPASNSLYAYAVTGGGTTHVVLVNTSATTSYNVSVAFSAPVSHASFLTLTGPSLGATSGQLLNGAVIQADGSWAETVPPSLPIAGGQLQVPVAAGSALLLNAQ